MKRFRSAWLAAASVAVWIAVAGARPRYGGTLRVETSAAMRTLNPAAAPADAADLAARRVLFPLVFETLVTVDGDRGVRGVLALDWEADSAGTRWRFRLRPAVRLHDGTVLDSGRVAAALSAREPAWQVAADVNAITIEPGAPVADLPWQLAAPRYAIAFGRTGGGEPIGTGPFAIERWEPKRLRLRAHENHWQGRPFPDAVHVEMGRSLEAQLASLEAGRADIAAIAVQDVRRAASRGLRVVTSSPRELVALVFPGKPPAPLPLRQALTLAVDRRAMWNALLQRRGEPASSLLPQWLRGHARPGEVPLDRPRARSIVLALPPAQRALTIRVPAADPLLRSIAERVAVDARDAGLVLTVDIAGTTAVRGARAQLVRAGIEATTPDRALAGLLRELGLAAATDPGSVEEIHRSEQTLLDRGDVVPLAHLPDVYAVARVDSWNEPMVWPSGALNLGSIWLKPAP